MNSVKKTLLGILGVTGVTGLWFSLEHQQGEREQVSDERIIGKDLIAGTPVVMHNILGCNTRYNGEIQFNGADFDACQELFLASSYLERLPGEIKYSLIQFEGSYAMPKNTNENVLPLKADLVLAFNDVSTGKMTLVSYRKTDFDRWDMARTYNLNPDNKEQNQNLLTMDLETFERMEELSTQYYFARKIKDYKPKSHMIADMTGK